VEGTVLQVVSIAVAGVAAALTATNVLAKLLTQFMTVLAKARSLKKEIAGTRSKRKRPVKKMRRIEDKEIHEKFVQMQHLLKEGRSQEAEEIFRRVRPSGLSEEVD
jgi:hypothetical protein